MEVIRAYFYLHILGYVALFKYTRYYTTKYNTSSMTYKIVGESGQLPTKRYRNLVVTCTNYLTFSKKYAIIGVIVENIM